MCRVYAGGQTSSKRTFLPYKRDLDGRTFLPYKRDLDDRTFLPHKRDPLINPVQGPYSGVPSVSSHHLGINPVVREIKNHYRNY